MKFELALGWDHFKSYQKHLFHHLTGCRLWTTAHVILHMLHFRLEGQNRSRSIGVLFSPQAKKITSKTYFVFLVLASIGKTRNDRCDPAGRRDFAGIDHNQQLHQVIVHLTAAGLNNVDIFAADGLSDFHT